MEDNARAEQLERFIARLYRSGLAVSPASFRAWALKQLRSLIRFDGALWGSGTVTDWHFNTVTVIGVSESFPTALEETRRINPMLRKLFNNFDNPTDMEDACPDREFYKSEIYKQVFERYGIARILATAHVEPRTGLYSLLSLYRKSRDDRFTAEEKALQKRAVYHLFQAASHAFFLHLWRTHIERPANSAAAVVDRKGFYYEAQPRFLDLAEEFFPDNDKPSLPFEPPAAGKTERIGKLCVKSEALGDLLCIYMWPAGPLDRLTIREREIVYAVTQGLSFKQAARRIGVAPSTVANHLYRVYRKLGVSSRTQLAGLVYPGSAT